MSKPNLPADDLHVDDLTWREHDILVLLAERLTNREIAQRLHLAESTVKDYVGRILSKLYVKNRRQAVEKANALGLLAAERKPTETAPSNLPAERTTFIGRQQELAEIASLLGETRLLTLAGPGGIGKTRLALQAAQQAANNFENGCCFVSLAPIQSIEHIAQTIAEALKFPLATNEDPKHQMLRHLKKWQVLLVLDNFEHLLDGAELVSEILEAAPSVSVLATSREKLNLHSETIFNITGLDFPEQDIANSARAYDAITLFIQSANKVRPGFDPSADELALIANICQIVQGMPLAIELAAAWLHMLSVAEIASELEHGFEILTTEVRDMPTRHRSIRAVFDYSWSLLPEDEQQIFMQLAVFRGGFTREAAQQVTGATLQQLASLVNRSFLSHDPDSGRMEVHELLRQYTYARLGEIPEALGMAEEAHAAYYAVFMWEHWNQIKSPQQLQALAEIEADIENVRAAWRFYLAQANATQLWKLIRGLWYVYWIRWWNHAGMVLFAQAASLLPEHTEDTEDTDMIALRALVLAFQGYFMSWIELSEQAIQLVRQSIAVLQTLDHPEALIFAYYSLVLNAYFQRRFTEEMEACAEITALATEFGDKWLLAFTLYAPGMGAVIEKDFAEAQRYAEWSLGLYAELGDVIGTTNPLIALGHVAFGRGELEKARDHYLRSLEISEQVGYYYASQTSSKYLGKVNLLLGDHAASEKHLLHALTIAYDIGFVRDVIKLLFEIACLRAAQGELARAVELLAMVLQHPTSDQARWLEEDNLRETAAARLAELAPQLPAEIFAAAQQRGQTLQPDNIVTELTTGRSQHT